MNSDPRKVSPRALQILGLRAAGQTRSGIAYRLGISVHTVACHLTRIYKALEVGNVFDAVRVAKERFPDFNPPNLHGIDFPNPEQAGPEPGLNISAPLLALPVKPGQPLTVQFTINLTLPPYPVVKSAG